MPRAPRPAASRRRRAIVISAVGAVQVFRIGYSVSQALPAGAATTLLSQGKVATASSTENAGPPAAAAAWSHDGVVGYAAYKVADTVTSHEAWSLGSYCTFTADGTIVAERGFAAPMNAGVTFHDLLTVSRGGAGAITHIINETGAEAQGTATVPVNLVSYP